MLVPTIVLSLILIEGSAIAAETSEPSNSKQEKANPKQEKKKQVPDSVQRAPTSPETSTRGESSYYEMDSNKLPVGSSRWFEQMERESKFSRRP
jgi:hypothetical protein